MADLDSFSSSEFKVTNQLSAFDTHVTNAKPMCNSCFGTGHRQHSVYKVPAVTFRQIKICNLVPHGQAQTTTLIAPLLIVGRGVRSSTATLLESVGLMIHRTWKHHSKACRFVRPMKGEHTIPLERLATNTE